MSDSAEVHKCQNAERDKTADKLAATQPILSSSICLKCVSHRTVVSGKGSVFILCSSGGTRHPRKHLCNAESIENQWKSEAPAELATPWFGRSLTLPANEMVG